jgi:hypothetical protein
MSCKGSPKKLHGQGESRSSNANLDRPKCNLGHSVHPGAQPANRAAIRAGTLADISATKFNLFPEPHVPTPSFAFRSAEKQFQSPLRNGLSREIDQRSALQCQNYFGFSNLSSHRLNASIYGTQSALDRISLLIGLPMNQCKSRGNLKFRVLMFY